MKVSRYPGRDSWGELLRRPELEREGLKENVLSILKAVKERGDEALREFTMRFDGVEVKEFLIDEERIKSSGKLLSASLKKAIRKAAANIRKFHASQIEGPKKIKIHTGVTAWRKSVAIDMVGLYIPGGSAPLFSSVLMLGIPAKIAGCRDIIICTPPGKDGTVDPAILFASKIAGIRKIYKIGGAQAIAAMAYGTESIGRVYKIFGPGNQFVTCAKQLVQQDGVAIDMPAGPSEVAVLADKTAIPAFIAADLISQAEHGTDSQAMLVTDSERIIDAVQQELAEQMKVLPRQEIASKALDNGRMILVNDMKEGLEMLNQYAPEHLIIVCRKASMLIKGVTNAGSVFIGNYSCESLGDYASGPNHTLPTNGYAKAYSGVSVDSFVKKITFQEVTKAGIRELGPTVVEMADGEGLKGHAEAVRKRVQSSMSKV